jgi:hypothetical protein
MPDAAFKNRIYPEGMPTVLHRNNATVGASLVSLLSSFCCRFFVVVSTAVRTQNAPNRIAPTNANTAQIIRTFSFRAMSTSHASHDVDGSKDTRSQHGFEDLNKAGQGRFRKIYH